MTRTRLAFLGPRGTYAEQAALQHCADCDLLPLPRIAAVAMAVDSGMADEGVVPIENSIEGSVTETLDVLIHESRLRIARELVVPIEHCLLVAPGTPAPDVQVIYSHPQALAQCRRFMERCFPNARVEPAMSTAAAVETALAQPGAAAIGARRAAELYSAEVLAHGVQDSDTNETRFVVLAPEDGPPTGHDKTSIAFSVAEDRPGVLVAVLQEFAGEQINLTKIESRPSREQLGRYIFLVDCEGHRADPLLAAVLERVRARCNFFKVFGSYPRYNG